ncbi:NADH-quinone oxidoreductase subunit C/D [bacterium]|nr:NADH-quinone oxidoreductase subunit C/D [bacterium]
MAAAEQTNNVIAELAGKFGEDALTLQPTADHIPTVWLAADKIAEALRFLKDGVAGGYKYLFDLTAIDERVRVHREGQPDSDFTVVYHLVSYDRNSDVRVKVPLKGDHPSLDSATKIWPNANWYEREVFDMFGLKFNGHPHLRRILMPEYWEGHPLRKEHPARATEMGPFQLPEDEAIRRQESMLFKPEDWGLTTWEDDHDFMFLNLGPQHPGTHGIIRLILQLSGEEVVNMVPDIGYHHRGAEKMGERQSWHTYIPYTDRIDYLGGVLNNHAYCLTVEQLAGIELPDRAKTIRIMMSELFRIASHLVWYGTFAQDLGVMSPVFYTFNDRERIFEMVEAICGGRMHPSWFRIGGVAHDLPLGWDKMVRAFVERMPKRLVEYNKIVMKNKMFQARTKGVGAFTTEEAIDWGQSGPGLRATGFAWDMRKKRPYGGYENFEFDIPTAEGGDCFARAEVRLEEINQSLRIVKQCLENMPAGDYKSRHPLTTPPLKDRTMHDIETLITHFLSVSWGPVVPPGEATFIYEASKGHNAYYCVSDGNTMSYRTRIRTPSFAHIQMMPLLCKGALVPDVLAILGALDFVLADLDR